MIMLCWWLYDMRGDPAGGRWLLLGWWRAPCPRGSVRPNWLPWISARYASAKVVSRRSKTVEMNENTKGLSTPADFSTTGKAGRCLWWPVVPWTSWPKTLPLQQRSFLSLEPIIGWREDLFPRLKLEWGPHQISTATASGSLGSTDLFSGTAVHTSVQTTSGRRWAPRRQDSGCTPQLPVTSPAFATDFHFYRTISRELKGTKGKLKYCTDFSLFGTIFKKN